MSIGSPQPPPAPDMSDCTAKRIRLHGKVKVVTSFPNQCGKWQFVDSFSDFTVQNVESFPDIKEQFVSSFPGVP